MARGQRKAPAHPRRTPGDGRGPGRVLQPVVARVREGDGRRPRVPRARTLELFGHPGRVQAEPRGGRSGAQDRPDAGCRAAVDRIFANPGYLRPGLCNSARSLAHAAGAWEITLNRVFRRFGSGGTAFFRNHLRGNRAADRAADRPRSRGGGRGRSGSGRFRDRELRLFAAARNSPEERWRRWTALRFARRVGVYEIRTFWYVRGLGRASSCL